MRGKGIGGIAPSAGASPGRTISAAVVSLRRCQPRPQVRPPRGAFPARSALGPPRNLPGQPTLDAHTSSAPKARFTDSGLQGLGREGEMTRGRPASGDLNSSPPLSPLSPTPTPALRPICFPRAGDALSSAGRAWP